MRPGANRSSASSRMLSVMVAFTTAFGALFTVTPPAPVRAVPLLGGQLFSTGSSVEIEVLPASAGLTSQLFLLEPEEIFIATNREQGKVVEIGPFENGVELLFGIRVN